jgi:hypothetical protein
MHKGDGYLYVADVGEEVAEDMAETERQDLGKNLIPADGFVWAEV